MKPAIPPPSRSVAESDIANNSHGPSHAVPARPMRTTLGNYELRCVLGSGGMANVYLGQRVDVAGRIQLAAIKVMLPELAEEPRWLDLFFDEARVTSRIRHPSVCNVLDFGFDNGVPYLATEYVMGETLGDLMTAVHHDPRTRGAAGALSAYIIRQACEGVHAAHEACDEEGEPLRIVHRDISPQNIMVGYDGRVRVLDFGIARSADQQHETQPGVLRGRFAYMAPEQMGGGVLDRRADIWSLGVLLWEGASGERLFRKDTMSETVRAVLAAPVESSLLTAKVPAPLLNIVQRAVVREPGFRYSTARKMGDDLEALTSTGAPQLQATMRRVFAARFEAKKQLLATGTRGRRSVPPAGIGHRSASFHAHARLSLESTRDLSSAQSTSMAQGVVATSSAPPTVSGIRRALSAVEVPKTPPTSAPPARNAFGFPKLVASVVVAASVVASLLALDADIYAHASRPSVAPQGGHKQVALGEIVVDAAAPTPVVRVEAVDVGQTPLRPEFHEGPRVLEFSSVDPGPPVVMQLEVTQNEATSVPLPVAPTPSQQIAPGRSSPHR